MRRFTTLALGLSLVAITLTACGGDSESSGGSTASYCSRIQAYKDKSDSLDEIFGGDGAPSSDDTKRAFTTMQEMANDMRKGAPAEIKADVALVSGGIDDVVKLFEKYDWDVTELFSSSDAEAMQAVLDNAETQAASDRLDKFSSKTCGIETES